MDAVVSCVVTLGLHGLLVFAVLWLGGAPAGSAISAAGQSGSGVSDTDGLVVVVIDAPMPWANKPQRGSNALDVPVLPEAPSSTELPQTAIASPQRGGVSPISARGATTTLPAVSLDGSGSAGSARGAASANNNGTYVDALRRAIATKWEALHPGQRVPNCSLLIDQEPGGQVNRAAATCPDAADLRARWRRPPLWHSLCHISDTKRNLFRSSS